MKETPEQTCARVIREQEKLKQQEWHGQVWRPTISEQERKERTKQIDRGEIPF